MRVICGWCGEVAAASSCSTCGRDPAEAWTQRGQEPPTVRTDAAGRPTLDARAIRARLREARAEIGGDATVARLAEFLGVSDKTVRRWQKVTG